jgi:hypothetical protein
MKKVIRLTETDLEKIVRKVIAEQEDSNGRTIEKTTGQIQNLRSDLLDKWKSYFPDVAWFQQIRQDSKANKFKIIDAQNLQNQGLQKMYSAYRTFIDPSVPDLNDAANFYRWLEEKSVAQKFHNAPTKWFSDLGKTQQLLTGMIPVLTVSQYPQTLPYEESLGKAQRISPELKQNTLFSSTNQVLAKKAYEMITKV